MLKLFKHFVTGFGVIGIAYAASMSVARADDSRSANPAATKPVVVFAAASLRNALDEILATYQARSGYKAIASYAGSNALARQIENGAPADIFISADLNWMTHLVEREKVRNEDVVLLLRNKLVVIAPAGKATPLDLASSSALASRLGTGRLSVAETTGVPAGRYAKSALEQLGLWASVSGKLAQADNVRGALLFVARGEAPLGIVYSSDAAAEPKVAIVAEFKAGTHPPIVYPAAVLAASQNPQARAFFAHLTSAPVRTIFGKHGFGAPEKPGT